MTRAGIELDPRHWSTSDGHRHTSVPAPVPLDWRRTCDDGGLFYVAGPYTIRREPYGATGATYTVHRDGVQLSSLAFYARLRDAKARAVSNAEGRDVVNVA